MKNKKKAILIPFDSFREKEMFESVKKVIESELPLKAVIASETIAEPRSVFSVSKEKINVDMLLSYLQKCTEKNLLVAFTGKDMGCDDSDFVFGAAIVNGLCCVVSSNRLKKNADRLAKETLHELGHCFGLNHCNNDCAMRFSSSVEEVDLKPAKLCNDCKNYLNADN